LNQQTARSITDAVQALRGFVENIEQSSGVSSAGMISATNQMAKSIETLTQTTSSSIGRMEAGAALLGIASEEFAAAGTHVTGVMGQVAGVSAELTEISGSLTTGVSAMQRLLSDYQAQREAVGLLVAELRATVEAASREAALTEGILNRIEGSAELLGAAQNQADEYLNGVSRVLSEAHAVFTREITGTLNNANTEFHTRLTTAVNMLSGAIEELEVTLTEMSAKR
jgi:cell division septum initiation protein DivIVA